MSFPEVRYGMIRHIDPHGDPHKFAKEINEVFQDLYHLHTTGECLHKPANIVVSMRGDMADKANGTYCRYCTQRIKPRRIEWELDGPLPSPPLSA